MVEKNTSFLKIPVNRIIALILMDIMAVMVSSFGAIFLRFEFSFKEIPKEYLERYEKFLPYTIVLTLFFFLIWKLYKSVWRYASATELINIAFATSCAALGQTILCVIMEWVMPRSYYVLYWFFLFGLTCVIRFSYRIMRVLNSRRSSILGRKPRINVMVIGAGAAANMILKEIEVSQYINLRVKCIIDDNPGCHGKLLRGIPIAGGRDKILEAVSEYGIDEIIYAIPSANRQTRKEILEICKETGCKLRAIPGTYQLINGEVSVSKLQEVEIEDLLGREPVKTNIEEIMGYVSGKVVMVTGGGGSIGSELCRQIAGHHPKQLIIVDIYENNAYDIQQELVRKYRDLDLKVLIASVRNTNRMEQIFETYRPDIVYHAAAHKHVPLMEDSPNEAVKNNVLGTWKVVQAADKWKVKRFVMISTDKAVNPTNIMGATKRICEMIIQTYNKHSETEFVAVRFGNVLGSNGSVIPLFKKQIAEGGPVTVTDPGIIRYFMTIPEAVSLVLQAGAYARGGEIFVLDMGEPVKILDLAQNLIKLSGYKVGEDIEIKFTGLRPGEKLYEEMLMAEEGMKDTANKMIHIGQPIELNEEKFMAQLEELKEYVVREPYDIREYVKQIVPTYVPKEG
ncbi:polysaccharide biosynthesis protein [Acetatifactor muris]|uniref:UDP-N-acetyl-alpha-D-glucosamine C6 dehydratase n=1 Tax=Acetatifactor muris TaxID=879566 RepID=A0A2K4ZI82_9FIRM|nr:nucleoside-diphosphate sugar epimerase/dehydratase [Acetatifactor muris]MCR2048370.1 polysaccharide biosynthesis protein [Acetatifactor muris]SOY30174.1 UDP-N-acetyl-alpha-D-glucosamine C6 dehydratase [Acetatifactor muris]